MLFIISNSKLGIWFCSQPRIDLNSQSNFFDVLNRPYKYLSYTLSTLSTKQRALKTIYMLVSPLWKTMSSRLNRRLTAKITFHDVLHGFQACRGTGTAALDSKVIQQLMVMREMVLFKIFLYLHKAYTALYQDRCLGILVEYGVGPRTIRLLRTYWGCLTMVARDGRYFGMMFKGYRVLT